MKKFPSIGRFLDVSNVSVLNWIHSYREEITTLRTESEAIEVLELDEMQTYIGSKKTTLGSGFSLLAIEETRRQKSFGKKSNITK